MCQNPFPERNCKSLLSLFSISPVSGSKLAIFPSSELREPTPRERRERGVPAGPRLPSMDAPGKASAKPRVKATRSRSPRRARRRTRTECSSKARASWAATLPASGFRGSKPPTSAPNPNSVSGVMVRQGFASTSASKPASPLSPRTSLEQTARTPRRLHVVQPPCTRLETPQHHVLMTPSRRATSGLAHQNRLPVLPRILRLHCC
mmetsp:Transcript_59350/g.164105  ORF Transcript_59350/g.164105 Transcript_59350/m.164105 type:complete len:206 (+) Transcript_59350:138-755(+)